MFDSRKKRKIDTSKSNDFESRLMYIKEKVGINSDLEFRKVPLSIPSQKTACLIYLRNLIDIDSLNQKVILPLSQTVKKLDEVGILNVFYRCLK